MAVSDRPRVLLVGPDAFDSVIDSHRRALESHYEVRVYDPYSPPWWTRPFGGSRAHRLGDAWRQLSRVVAREPLASRERPLLRAAESFDPDIVMITCIHQLRPSVVSSLKRGHPGRRVFGIFSDHLANFDRGYFFAADYDALFFKDRFIVERFRSKLGWTHVHYLPQACDRVLHRRTPVDAADRSRFECDITLFGNPYLYRNEALRPLIDRNVKIWGPPPPRWVDHPTRALFTGRYVAGQDKSKAMLCSRIVLNQNHYAEIQGTNKRTFEVAAIGAFQLTDTPALRDVFDPETEVASFEGRADMLEKIDHYLPREEERASMARRAEARALAEHTYEHRWAAYLEVLGVRPPAGFPVPVESLAVRAR